MKPLLGGKGADLAEMSQKSWNSCYFPMFVEFAEKHRLEIELCQHQNFYPDLTFTHKDSGNRFAVDI